MALPKSSTQETAVEAQRAVNEETGLTVEFDRPLGDISYVYRFQRQTIFKLVSFFLFAGRPERWGPSPGYAAGVQSAGGCRSRRRNTAITPASGRWWSGAPRAVAKD
jgi:hypothetical protein